MGYEPDPELWPVRIASIITRVRSLLGDPAAVLEPTSLLSELLAEEGLTEGISELWRRQDDQAMRAAEVEFLMFQALHQMDRDGEAVPAGGEFSGTTVSLFIGRMGWQGSSTFAPSIRSAYRASVRLLARGQTPWAAFGTRWPNVDRLAEQAWRAWHENLDVAAAVTARVTVEEAVKRALEDAGAQGWEDEKAARREALLFDTVVTTPKGFAPLDREATKTTLSGTRTLGNDAAHDGVVNNAALEEAILRLLPRALTSLASAVDALTRNGSK